MKSTSTSSATFVYPPEYVNISHAQAECAIWSAEPAAIYQLFVLFSLHRLRTPQSFTYKTSNSALNQKIHALRSLPEILDEIQASGVDALTGLAVFEALGERLRAETLVKPPASEVFADPFLFHAVVDMKLHVSHTVRSSTP